MTPTLPQSNANSDLCRAVEFLNSIGIPTRFGQVPASSFLPNVAIHQGTLIVEAQCRLSNLLHEAGHLAITPKRYRHLMEADVSKGIEAMIDRFNLEDTEPDSPLYRAVVQCSDQEATAWAYAAGTHLGLEPKAIIDDHEYDGEGRNIRIGLSRNQYIGINGLAFAGFCSSNSRGHMPAFPKLKFWTQEI